ncbi:MAG: hypothetical protein KF746_21225 [Chitinophagaceae bacterium]|nr:hypothetical protein [Chitinophagaceae bacterium]
MLKKITPCFIALFIFQQAGAQGKQIQYLAQQIAELQVYIGYLKKGYNIVQTGIHTIRDIRNGEFNLHSLYYSSLKTVNPKIKQSAQSVGIIANLQYVTKSIGSLRKTVRESNTLPEPHRQFILQCCDKLADDIDKTSEFFTDIISSGLQMSDDERMNRISGLYEKTVDQSVFVQQLLSQTITLLQSIAQEQADEDLLKNFHDIK